MKKMEKALSFILAVIMLLTAVPVQSFALFDNLNPTVVKVEFADDLPISNQHVQNESRYMGGIDKTIVSGLGGSYMYDYKVYLSNGKVLEAEDGYYEEKWPLINRIRYCSVVLMVSPTECEEAIAQGKETVTAEVMVMLAVKDDAVVPFEAELEKAIIPEMVKDVRLLDPMPEINEDYDLTACFEGKKFEVEYSDGEKKVYTLEKKETEYGEEFFFGDEPLYIWSDTESYEDELTGEKGCAERIYIEYIDASIAFYEKKIPSPFEKIEILDHTIGKDGVNGVSYRITYKDGRTVENTKTFDAVKEADGYVVIDNIDGNDVYVYISCFEEDYFFSISIGYYQWFVNDSVVGETRDICDCICHENGIKYVISIFLRKIWEIFGIKEACECGSWHW